MKTLLLTIIFSTSISITSYKSYNHQQSDDILLDISYVIQTRGTYKQIMFSKDLILYSDIINNKKTSKKPPKDLWLKIHKSLNKLHLNELHKIKAPTNEKNRDVALTAYIEINLKNETTITSSYFDHGNPPKELQSIVNILLSHSQIMD